MYIRAISNRLAKKEICESIENEFKFEWSKRKYKFTIDKHILLREGKIFLSQFIDMKDLEWIYLTKEGKISKRILKLLKKNNREDLNWMIINQFMSRFVVRPETYYFDFTQEEWQAGDFCDDGSCFFGDRREAPRLIRESGGGAIRFYKNGKGIGRAWILPEKNNCFAVFNAYGIDLRTIATIIGLFVKKPVCQLNWINTYDTKGYIYINHNLVFGVGIPNNFIYPYDLRISGIE